MVSVHKEPTVLCPVRTQTEDSCLQAKMKACTRNRAAGVLSFDFPTSRMGFAVIQTGVQWLNLGSLPPRFKSSFTLYPVKYWVRITSPKAPEHTSGNFAVAPDLSPGPSPCLWARVWAAQVESLGRQPVPPEINHQAMSKHKGRILLLLTF
ncbi:hypothetical protein AAY473_034536 [Plecturocebus cupreus]